MANPLILDTDGGVDDAQALYMLIAAGRVPMAVTTVFGNVTLEHATANMVALLDLAGVDVPVHAGAARPLNGAVIDARHVHGDEGLGTARRPATRRKAAGQDAVSFLRDTFRAAAAAGRRVDILMIGPFTNLALALRQEPGIVAGIGQLAIMGGTIHGRGNTTPAAEFNVFADPEAAQIVMTCGAETLIAPWESCLAHAMSGERMEALFDGLPETPLRSLSRDLARHARKVAAGFGRGDSFAFVDPLAAAAVIDPGVVTKSVTASVDVALAPGITRGMLVVDPSGRLGTPRVTLIEEARIERLIAIYADSVALEPGPV
ncbi:MAG: nucleoside hydrolase [Rubellimicrobium sp.]|nr:nucleoside hydrolase [Rubellimicrobium sp.]